MCAEIQSIKTDVKRLEDIAKANTIDILHINDDIRNIRETMSTKDDISRILNAIDKFAGVSENYKRKDLERGHMLMEQNDKLENHEGSLILLETPK